MDAASPTHRLLVRASVGLIQGIALYLLTHAVQTNRWPSTDRAIFAPLVQIAIFTPLVFQFGVGVLRTRTLLIWAGVVTLVLIGLGLHDAARAATNPGDLRIGVFGLIPGPSLIMTGFVALGLFIAQSLVTAGDAEPKFLAPYPGYFDAGWKIELQIAAAILFVGAFWVLLFLGSALLALIDVRFLRRLIEHQWFSIPVTTLALATAIHLTDVRTSIIAGLRSLIHIVLSWLLPMIAIIVGIFLVSLPFTGLEPLWRTSHAASLLLGVSAALIILINAVYGDGAGEEPAPRILRIAGSAAAIELVPLAIIATSAIGLRVTQYGWTVDRVYAAGATVVAACYAVGYAYSAFGRGAWLRRLEPCNVLTSFVILATLLALLTPLADPARISVASQVSRLKSGAVAPDKFDYAYLRWSGQRYGGDALRTLASGDDVAIKDGADQALRMANRFTPGIAVPTDAELAAAITVYPAGRALPDDFLRQKWPAATQFMRPQCFNNKALKCDAFLVDLDGDGSDEIVIMDAPPASRAVVFKAGASGGWNVAGNIQTGANCESVREALRAGNFTLTLPVWKDLNVAGRIFHMAPALPNPINCR